MNKKLLEVYSDYLILSSSQTSATGLSQILDGQASHDQITRLLLSETFSSKDLWKLVKKDVFENESKDAVLIIDDSVEEKEWSEESDIIRWHYDHCKNKPVKGINIVNLIYYSNGVSIPIAFEAIKKTETVVDPKTGESKRVSPVTKNEIYRKFIRIAKENNIKFSYVISDIGFSSKENMVTVKKKFKKDFIQAIKANRRVALSESDRRQKKFVQVRSLPLEEGSEINVYLKELNFAVRLIKQVFKNKDGSVGILFLVSSDLNLSFEKITTLYQKRWKIEEFYKSIKSNASFSKSPASSVRARINHCFASIYAFFKLEKIKMMTNLNHFAIKKRIYLHALKFAYDELETLSGSKNRLALIG